MDREFRYTQKDFNRARAFLLQLTGIKLADSKDSLVYSRLVPRLRKLQLEDVRRYVDYLEQHPEEEEHFINALTTNLTSFFREPHHFDILSEFIQRGEVVNRVWCAASSTGEEPYSIAMTLVNAAGGFASSAQVIASDIDSNVLRHASDGIYPLEKVNPLNNKKLFFKRGVGVNAGKARVCAQLRKLLEFQKINLLDEEYPVKAGLDVIFCRNVMIYFDKDTQEKILLKLLSKLRTGGLYIAGHSENFSHFSHLMKPIGRTAYIKL